MLRVAEKRFTADAIIMDSVVQPQTREKGGEKKGRARAGRVYGRRKEGAQTLWGMLYDAGIVSRSPEGLGKMMTVIVTTCAAFGLTVSEAKTEIMCLQKQGWGARAVHRYCSRPGVKTNGRVCVLERGYQRRLGPHKCRGNASNPEGMDALWTV